MARDPPLGRPSMKLRQALLGCSAGLLRTIAGARGLRVDASTLRSELVDALGAELTRASAAGDLWRDLEEAERAVVGQVGAAGGRHDADLLLRRLASRLGQSAPEVGPERMLARLAERGILFRVFSAGGSASGTSYVLPEEYLDAVAGWSADAAPALPKATDLSPTTILRNDPVVDSFVLASALRREGWNRAARPLVGGSTPSARQVLGRLRPPTPEVEDRRTSERWGLLLRLGSRGGWIRSGAWPMPDDERLGPLLQDRWPLVESLWQAYRAARGSGEDRPAGESSARSDVAAEDLLHVLADLPIGTWHPADELERWVSRELGWDEPHERSLDRLLGGAWFWLGLVCWAMADHGRRLLSTTATLGALAGRASPPDRAPGPAAVLEDGLQLVASLAGDVGVLYAVEPYLALVGGVVERKYMLTAASFSRGVRLGGSAEDARALLMQLAGGTLPLAWEQAIGAWGAEVGRLRMDARVVLSATDARTFERALEVPRLSEAVGERLSDRAAWLVPERLAAALHGLDEGGRPLALGPGLRIDARRPERGAILDGGGAELLWIVLGALARVDPGMLAGLEGAAGLRAALELVLTPAAREQLDRRAAALADRLTQERQRPTGQRRPRDSMV